MMNSFKNQKNYKYKKYFRNLSYTLKNLNNNFLYYNPDIYKKDLEKDKIKFNYGFFKNPFKKVCYSMTKIKLKNLKFVLSHIMLVIKYLIKN